ncbi:MAG: SRPBCC family protein [Dermatophilaceae bacterium]
MIIERTVTVERPVADVYAYLSDFTTTTEWDAGTIRTTLESGDGGVGTSYRNLSKFLGRETELTYVITDLEPDRLIKLRGENKTVIAHDTMSLAATPSGGTQITYRAEFDFKGLARFVVPFLGGAFRRLGDEAAAGLRAALTVN